MAHIPEGDQPRLELNPAQQRLLLGTAVTLGLSVAGAIAALASSERGRAILATVRDEATQIGKEALDDFGAVLRREGSRIGSEALSKVHERIVIPHGTDLWHAFQASLPFGGRRISGGDTSSN